MKRKAIKKLYSTFRVVLKYNGVARIRQSGTTFFVNKAKFRIENMDLSDKCPITKQIDNIDDTIKELNERIGELSHENGAIRDVDSFLLL